MINGERCCMCDAPATTKGKTGALCASHTDSAVAVFLQTAIEAGRGDGDGLDEMPEAELLELARSYNFRGRVRRLEMTRWIRSMRGMDAVLGE